jgi:hypothetical protein
LRLRGYEWSRRRAACWGAIVFRRLRRISVAPYSSVIPHKAVAPHSSVGACIAFTRSISRAARSRYSRRFRAKPENMEPPQPHLGTIRSRSPRKTVVNKTRRDRAHDCGSSHEGRVAHYAECGGRRRTRRVAHDAECRGRRRPREQTRRDRAPAVVSHARIAKHQPPPAAASTRIKPPSD